MKIILIITCLLVFASAANAQLISNKDSSQIHAMIDDWNKAWEIKDYTLAAKWYSNNAWFTNAFGDKRTGQKDIESLFKEVFALPFVMAGKSETTNHQFQVLDNDHVVVHTSVIRKGQQMPDGSVLPDRKTTHMRVFQEEKGEWRIKAHLISDARDKQLPKH